MKKKYLPFLISLSVLLVLCLYILSSETQVKEHPPVKYISVLTRGALNESWANFKQGAEQAGVDLSAEIHFVSLSADSGDKVEEQINLLLKEMESDSDAIIIAPSDYKRLADPLDDNIKNIPIILVESDADTQHSYTSVTCDNTSMGDALALEVMRHGNMRKNILFINGNLQCGSVIEREKSFRESMKQSHNVLIDYKGSNSSSKELLDYLLNNKIDVITAMDTELLEMAAEALNEYEEYQRINKIELYGVGSGSKVISYMDKGYITSTVVQDDFSMGYQGVKDAINTINGKVISSNSNIAYTIVDREHMYSEENQRLLFPFVR